ncbi:MAG: alpha/beta hydrolase [Proteobacteria bacterium]|nr:alpha/beta hydrolase [Pseudomonadota bacterium]
MKTKTPEALAFESFGDKDKPVLYFAHANAYPPASYRSIIEPLTRDHHVVSYLQRPLWSNPPKPASLSNWHELADDVIRFFDQQGLKNIIVVGHSLGAVTSFMATRKRPDLIKALVMIEPVTFPWVLCSISHLMPSIIKQRIGIIKKTLNRPDCWQSRQQAFDFHRKTRAFKKVSDKQLWHFIEAGVKKQKNHFTLSYPKHWEAQCYATITYFRNKLLKSELPILALRGQYSDTIPLSFWKKWQNNPKHKLVQIPAAGHLLPLEMPDQINPLIEQFISKHS